MFKSPKYFFQLKNAQLFPPSYQTHSFLVNLIPIDAFEQLQLLLRSPPHIKQWKQKMSNDMILFRIFLQVREAGDTVISISDHYFGMFAYVFFAGFALNLVR